METTSRTAYERPAGRARALGYKGFLAAFGLAALVAGCSSSGGDAGGNRDEETPQTNQPGGPTDGSGTGSSGGGDGSGGGSGGSGGGGGGGGSGT